MSFPPCPGCGAKYRDGEIGTVHKKDCPELVDKFAAQIRKGNLLDLYKVLQANPGTRKSVNWDKFAEQAEAVGLHYHPRIGLMERSMWEQIKEFVK